MALNGRFFCKSLKNKFNISIWNQTKTGSRNFKADSYRMECSDDEFDGLRPSDYSLTLNKNQILRKQASKCNGFIPIYKPRGYSADNLLEYLKLELSYNYLCCNLRSFNLNVGYARSLEPFADGIVTVCIGPSSRRTRNFILTPYEYKAKILFGVEHVNGNPDDNILVNRPIDHLTKNLIRKASQKLVGSYKQEIMHHIPPEIFVIESMNEKREIPLQRYGHSGQKVRLVTCKSITFIEPVELPYLELRIESNGTFSVRSFVRDLARELKTCANLVELTRVQEAIVHIDRDQMMQVHEIHAEKFDLFFKKYNQRYLELLEKYDDCFESANTFQYRAF